MQQLFDYQTEMVEDLLPEAFKQGHTNVCAVLPCGGGKTSIFSEIARKQAGKGRKTIITAHRRRLIKQIAERLKEFGVRYSVQMANLPDENWVEVDPSAEVIVGSMQTMVSRIGASNYAGAHLFMPDECHTITQNDYQRLRRHIAPRWCLGFTATPCYTDGSGFGPRDFSVLVEGCRIEDLIARQPPRLMPTEVWAPTEIGKKRKLGLDGGVSGDPVSQWIRHAAGLRTLVFCRTIKQCLAVAEDYKSEGIKALHINAETDDGERDEALAALQSGEILVIVCTPALMGVGTDLPRVECLQSLVKGGSVTAHWQAIGRIQRVAEGKERAVLLDHSAAVYWHGMPNMSPIWRLGEDDSVQMRNSSQRNENEDLKPNTCRVCGMVSVGSGKCPNCSTVLFAPRAEQPKLEREPLSKVHDEYDGEPEVPQADPRHQTIWKECLYIAFSKGLKATAAASMFKKRVGVWPDAAYVFPSVPFNLRFKAVSELFPDLKGERKRVRV